MKNVKGFTEVFMHRGNWAKNTTACCLVGKTPGNKAIYRSKDALDEIIFELAKYRADLIEKEMFEGLNDLEYMSWLCRSKYKVHISDDVLPGGVVTYTYELTYIYMSR